MPTSPDSAAPAFDGRRAQPWRRVAQAGFFLLFLLAPAFDLFRLDLNLKHFILFGHAWTLGLDDFLAGRSGPLDALWNLLWRGLLPIVLIVGGVLWVSWRWGRLYCGWLCPHFSVVELLNGLSRRAAGRWSVWQRKRLPSFWHGDGTVEPRARWWGLLLLLTLLLGFVWAITLLSYLLPPAEVWGRLLAGTSTRNQAVFLAVGTALFTLEFLFARHLFCRYACAVGLFQSLAWMANRKSLVVGYDRPRASDCADCGNACDHACPMLLTPRKVKRLMFACVQCGRCNTACETSQARAGRPPLLAWTRAHAESEAAFDARAARIIRLRPAPAEQE